MIEVLSMDVRILDDPMVIQKGMQLLSTERQEKIKAFKNPISGRLSLGAGILLSIAMKRKGLYEKRNEIKISKFGKPYLEGADFHFSLSHSGNYAICAFGKNPVGADIQIIKKKMPKHTDRILSNTEKEYLQSLDESERIVAFFQLWARKESLIKWDGRGLRLPLQEISFVQNGILMDMIHITDKKLYLSEYKTFHPDYVISICSESNLFSSKTEEIHAGFLTIL